MTDFDNERWEQERRDRLDRVTATDRNRQLLIDCYHSGQMTERQWQQHVADDPLLITPAP